MAFVWKEISPQSSLDTLVLYDDSGLGHLLSIAINEQAEDYGKYVVQGEKAGLIPDEMAHCGQKVRFRA